MSDPAGQRKNDYPRLWPDGPRPLGAASVRPRRASDDAEDPVVVLLALLRLLAADLDEAALGEAPQRVGERPPPALRTVEPPRQRGEQVLDRVPFAGVAVEHGFHLPLDRAEALLRQVGLAGFGDKYPWQLSGGMMQRTNLCRALIHEPDLLLLDEPFGALDQFTREELWATMQDLWMTKRTTVLLVTHDLREAGYLANRICVMSARPGRILEDSDVAFPRPRTMDLLYTPDFVALTQRLRALIMGVRTAATL